MAFVVFFKLRKKVGIKIFFGVKEKLSCIFAFLFSQFVSNHFAQLCAQTQALAATSPTFKCFSKQSAWPFSKPPQVDNRVELADLAA